MELKKHLVLKLQREFDVIQSDFNCIKEKGRIEAEIEKLDAEIKRIKESEIEDYDSSRYNRDLEKVQKNYNDYSSSF